MFKIPDAPEPLADLIKIGTENARDLFGADHRVVGREAMARGLAMLGEIDVADARKLVDELFQAVVREGLARRQPAGNA